MLITTTEKIPGQEYEVLGLVKGSTVRARHVFADLGASLKSIVGGEIGGYTTAINDARGQCMERMVQEASGMGADAIVSMRYETSSIMESSSELLAYGTAVKFRKE